MRMPWPTLRGPVEGPKSQEPRRGLVEAAQGAVEAGAHSLPPPLHLKMHLLYSGHHRNRNT
eukprot:scaffold318254_cov33-Tisochrysis_lutea.AAC.4